MILRSLKILLAFSLILTFCLQGQAAQTKYQSDINKWEQASRLIIANKTKKAQQILLEMLRNTVLSKSLIYLTLGRLAFQDGKFNQALQHYRGVEQDSPYWLEAKEELAWTYIRLDQPAQAIANGATLLTPIFLGKKGPEPYFMMSYANLMICDYEKIFHLSQMFKNNEATKVEELEKISSGKSSQVLNTAFEKLRNGPYHTSTVAKELPLLPRNFLRDEWFKKFWSEKNVSRALNRVQTMARSELKEYRSIIYKLHLVEAEVIQRLHLQESKLGQRSKLTKPIAKNSDTMTFPETNEIWVDELDNYHLDAKDCPKIMQVKL